MTLITAKVGDTNTYDITLTDGDSGDPLDLSGMTITFTVKHSLVDTDADALIVKTAGDGLAVDADPTSGLLTLTLEPEDTETLANAPSEYWDLQVDNGSEVRTPLSGRLALVPQVTQNRIGL